MEMQRVVEFSNPAFEAPKPPPKMPFPGPYGKKWILSGDDNSEMPGEDCHGRVIVNLLINLVVREVLYRIESGITVSQSTGEAFNKEVYFFFENCKNILLNKITLCSEDLAVLVKLNSIKKKRSSVLNRMLIIKLDKLMRGNELVIKYEIHDKVL